MVQSKAAVLSNFFKVYLIYPVETTDTNKRCPITQDTFPHLFHQKRWRFDQKTCLKHIKIQNRLEIAVESAKKNLGKRMN